MIDQTKAFIAANDRRLAAASEYAAADDAVAAAKEQWALADERMDAATRETERAAVALIASAGVAVPPNVTISNIDAARLIVRGYEAAQDALVEMSADALQRHLDDTLDARASTPEPR